MACFLDLHMFSLGVLISFLSGIIKVDDKSNATERESELAKNSFWVFRRFPVLFLL